MSVKEHYQKGTITELFNAGLISINIVTYFRYNEVFEAYLAKGLSRNKAYDLASDECGCSKRTIITAVEFVNR
jgi:hypothetical protein